MHSSHSKRVDDKIVNIHQPHVRPIVRGKEKRKLNLAANYKFLLWLAIRLLIIFSGMLLMKEDT